MREHRNPTTQGVEARGRERFAADLQNGHVAEPFRSIINRASPSPSGVAAMNAAVPLGLDDGGAGIVIGQGDFCHNGDGTLLDDDASRAIAAHTTPGREQTPLTGIAALDQIWRRAFLRLRTRYGSAPAVDEHRRELARNSKALELLRLMVAHPDVLDNELHPAISGLVADIRRRIVGLDPACCPKCYHELSADQAHDGGGEPIHGKIDIACEHCDHYERVDSDATNDD